MRLMDLNLREKGSSMRLRVSIFPKDGSMHGAHTARYTYQQGVGRYIQQGTPTNGGEGGIYRVIHTREVNLREAPWWVLNTPFLTLGGTLVGY